MNPCTSNPCSHSGICNGTSGTAICDCSVVSGYTGLTCDDDIDECTADAHHQHQCQNEGVCENVPGNYTCNCSLVTGYRGAFCDVDIDECSEAPPDDHHCINEGVCINLIGSYLCDCTGLPFLGTFCHIGYNTECLIRTL